MRINIIFSIAEFFIKQLSDCCNSIGYEFYFNTRADVVWDVVTLYEKMLPRHKRCLALMDKIQNRFRGRIDFYGKGIREIGNKANVLFPYKLSICIENCSINDYWTEKIADSILGYPVPIYCRCKNITDYFPEKLIVKITTNNIDFSLSVIKKIIDNPNEIYQEMLLYLGKDRKIIENQTHNL